MTWLLIRKKAVISSPWTPLSLGGALQGWWDFSDTSTLFDATSGGSNVTTNDTEILRVNDKSGNGIHLPKATNVTGHYYQRTPALLKLGAQNGLSVMEIDKSAEYAIGGGFGLQDVPIGNNVPSLSAVTVAKEGTRYSDLYGSTYKVSRPASSEPRLLSEWPNTVDYKQNRLYAYNVGGSGGWTGRYNFGPEAWRIEVHTANYTQPTNSLRGFVDGGATPVLSADVATFTQNTESSNASVVQIGQSTYGTQGANLSRGMSGQLGEIMFIAADLVTDVALRQKIEGHLAHKWGLTGSLPADHPYKTTPPIA